MVFTTHHYFRLYNIYQHPIICFDFRFIDTLFCIQKV